MAVKEKDERKLLQSIFDRHQVKLLNGVNFFNRD